MPSYTLPALFVAVVAMGPLTAQDKVALDWPQFRGPGGQGVSADKGLPVTWSDKDNVVWKVKLPGAGSSSPIIAGSKIFLSCFSGYSGSRQPGSDINQLKLQVVCLGRDKGEVIWSKEVAVKQPEQTTIRENHGYASSTPAADGERVYFFFGRSGVVAFDHAGNKQWQADVGGDSNGFGSGASPIVYQDFVIVNASIESQSVVALDRKSGKEKWRAKGIREAWNTPVLVQTADAKTELIVPIFRKILAFDPATGDQLWSCDTEIDWYMVPSVVAHDGIVYCIGGRTGGALAVKAGGRGDVTKSHRLWTGRKGSNVSSPIIHKGHLYWINDNTGVACCADAKTGALLYEKRVDRGDQAYASPVLADGKIVYLTRTGRGLVVAAKPEYELLAVNNFNERSMFNASPAVAGSRLYVRSDLHLYCLGRKD